jgi:hypothetical protein
LRKVSALSDKIRKANDNDNEEKEKKQIEKKQKLSASLKETLRYDLLKKKLYQKSKNNKM